MDGEEGDPGLIEQNGFRAIAVMHVEIKNGNALGTGRQSFPCGNGNVVQITKTHRLFAGGVVAGRTHEAEDVFAVTRGFQGIQRGGGGACA